MSLFACTNSGVPTRAKVKKVGVTVGTEVTRYLFYQVSGTYYQKPGTIIGCPVPVFKYPVLNIWNRYLLSRIGIVMEKSEPLLHQSCRLKIHY
jgi:hypothetical protein